MTHPIADERVTSVARSAHDAVEGRGVLTFRVFRGLPGLQALATEWAHVLENIEHPHFFHQYAWFDVILRTWPAETNEILFLVAYREDRAVAICPLKLGRARALGLPVRILAPPDPNAIAYPDFICADTPGNARLLSQVVEELRSRKDIGWDILTLPKVFSSSPVMTSASALARADLFSHQRGICYYFKCDGGMPALTAQISSGLRKHMRRCRRQLSDLGSLEFVSSRDPAALPALFDEFLALEASGWKGVTGEATAIRLDPGLVQFYSGLLARFVETGECEVNLLRLNGRNIAGQFCLISGGTWYHLKIAYDEEFDRFSPGFVLLEDVLSRLCADDQIHTANYLTGAEWADRWHPDKLDVIRLVVRNDTFMGRVAMQEIIMRRVIRQRILPLAAQVMRKVKAVRGMTTTL